MNGAVASACDKIFRRYRSAGFSIEVAHEQANQFGRRFIRVGDHAPELLRDETATPLEPAVIDVNPRSEDDLNATLDLIGAVI